MSANTPTTPPLTESQYYKLLDLIEHAIGTARANEYAYRLSRPEQKASEIKHQEAFGDLAMALARLTDFEN